MRGVADFLAADRLAGRYLLTVAGGFYGAVSLVALWEMIYNTGLPAQYWGMMNLPIGLFLGLTGFVVYRFRQTRALTLAQFFEKRYSRKFRYFAGTLCWVSGILNFGIFPLVSANLMVYFFGLPSSFLFYGYTVQTFWAIMAVYLSIAAYIACSGGQITIMITDFIQGAFLMLVFAVVVIFLLVNYNWADITAGLEVGVPEEKSLINPFTGSSNDSFDIWFFLIGLFAAIYNVRSWQGNSGYNAAAKTPHEAVVAGVIGNWRMIVSTICVIMIPLVAYAVLHLPKFALLAEPINNSLSVIADREVQNQMIVPMFLKNALPGWMFGLFAALILTCAISCDDSYMHAWGTIFVQDVIMPIRNKPFKNPQTHMKILRLSVIGVGLFGFVFSIFFPLKGYILMFFALTGAIYLGGAGAVIIGGLYWKRGTTAGAWTAMIVGTVIGFGGICVQQGWDHLIAHLLLLFPDSTFLLNHKTEFPINGQWIYFGAMIASSVCYIGVSLLGKKQIFNMDKLLHRGKYAVAYDIVTGAGENKKERISLKTLLGITPEFSRFERFLFYGTFVWLMGWWMMFIAGVVINTFYPIPDSAWSVFWYCYIIMSVILGVICTVWIFSGGVRDAFRLFRDLKQRHVIQTDDGFVRDADDH
ncbi:MAG: hypothetical protein LBM70_05590 [Victivallales bacterium]|jgi:SSS family solute:Na+ symporter|nr:hypothetical protein [Victivallales bacterium]